MICIKKILVQDIKLSEAKKSNPDIDFWKFLRFIFSFFYKDLFIGFLSYLVQLHY